MTRAKIGDGPWGAAIEYWMEQRRLRQADVVKLTEVNPNTISNAARGFDCSTRVLRKIAKALNVTLADILVSPAHHSKEAERRRLILDIAATVYDQIDERMHQGTLREPTTDESMEMANRALEREDALTQPDNTNRKSASNKRSVKQARRFGRK